VKAIDTLTDVVGLYALTPHGELGVYTERGRISIVHASTQVLGPQIRQLLKTYLADPDTSEYRLGVVYRRVDQTSSQGDTLRLEERALQQLFPAGAPATQGRTELQAANCEQNIRRGIQLLSTRRQPQFADAPVYLPVLYDRGTTLDQYSNRRAGRPTAEWIASGTRSFELDADVLVRSSPYAVANDLDASDAALHYPGARWRRPRSVSSPGP